MPAGGSGNQLTLAAGGRRVVGSAHHYSSPLHPGQSSARASCSFLRTPGCSASWAPVAPASWPAVLPVDGHMEHLRVLVLEELLEDVSHHATEGAEG